MCTIIAGYFAKENHYKTLENKLESAGFKDSDYTVYLNDSSENYLVSVKTNDETEINTAKNIFSENNAIRNYQFEGIDSDTSYENLKALIKERSKAEIPQKPHSHFKTNAEGIDSQVGF